MSLIILPGADKKKSESWSYENGKEILWYLENPMTRVVQLTSPISPIPHGFVRYKTNQPKEMDRIFRKLNEQERERNEQFLEKLYNSGRARYEACRSALNQRLHASDCKEWEKSFIREALQRMADKDHEAQKNSVYGVSGLEEKEAPIAPETKKVTVS